MIEKYLVGEDLTHHTCRRSIYSHVEKEQEGRGTGGEEAIDKRGGERGGVGDKTASAPQSVQRGRVFFLSPSSRFTLHHYRPK